MFTLPELEHFPLRHSPRGQCVSLANPRLTTVPSTFRFKSPPQPLTLIPRYFSATRSNPPDARSLANFLKTGNAFPCLSVEGDVKAFLILRMTKYETQSVRALELDVIAGTRSFEKYRAAFCDLVGVINPR